MRDIPLPTLGHICFVLSIICASFRVFGHPDRFVIATLLGTVVVFLGALCFAYALLRDDVGYLNTWKHYRERGFAGLDGRVWQMHPAILAGPIIVESFSVLL